MLEILYQIGHLILVYILPFLVAYIVIKRIEERIKLRIAPYFVVAILLLVVYGTILGIACYPIPPPHRIPLYYDVGNVVIMPIFILLMFIFLIKVKKQMGGADRAQIAGDLLKLFLIIGAVMCSLTIVGYNNNLLLDFS
jgi:cytochrome bd-type quinol oxidase subunit 2